MVINRFRVQFSIGPVRRASFVVKADSFAAAGLKAREELYAWEDQRQYDALPHLLSMKWQVDFVEALPQEGTDA